MANYNGDSNLSSIIDKPIDKYIITSLRSIVDDNKDNGNIVIWRDHIATKDTIPETEWNSIYPVKQYNDLYIGDEHIAGGYGFDTPYTREEILNLLKRVSDLEAKTNNTNDPSLPDEDNTDEPTKSPSTNNDEHNANTIKIDDTTSYKLYLDTELDKIFILTNKKPSISNIIVTCYEEKEKFENGEVIQYIEYSDLPLNEYLLTGLYCNINISYLTFEYDGTEKPESFYISYKCNEIGNRNSNNIVLDEYNHESDIIGEFNKPIKIYSEEQNSLCSISEIYRVQDPDSDPEVYQLRYKIEFKDAGKAKLNLLALNEQDITLKLNVITAEQTKISTPIYNICVTYPCFYGVNSKFALGANPDYTNAHFFITHKTKPKLFTFEHGTESTDGFIYIPQTIMNKNVNIQNINFVLSDTNIRFYWKTVKNESSETIKITFNNTEVNYYALYTPHDYKGSVKWYISLDYNENNI